MEAIGIFMDEKWFESENKKKRFLRFNGWFFKIIENFSVVFELEQNANFFNACLFVWKLGVWKIDQKLHTKIIKF